MAAPLPGPHAVRNQNCSGLDIDQEYRIERYVSCRLTQDEIVPGEPIRFECSASEFCSSHDDCPQPFGVCVGTPEANCEYPELPTEDCTSNADCTDRPDGLCNTPTWPAPELRCYPNGTCELVEPRSHCVYPRERCTSDADCTAAPGGTCVKRIVSPQCAQSECAAASDCSGGEVCGCVFGRGMCLPGDCERDGDCASGQLCEVDYMCGSPSGSFCTTAADECGPGLPECDAPSCGYTEGRWLCGQFRPMCCE